MRHPVPNLPLCHWLSQLFDLRAPSSTDVPVLLLNQPMEGVGTPLVLSLLSSPLCIGRGFEKTNKQKGGVVLGCAIYLS